MAPHGSYGVNAALAMVRMVVYGNQCPQGSLGGCRRAATALSFFMNNELYTCSGVGRKKER